MTEEIKLYINDRDLTFECEYRWEDDVEGDRVIGQYKGLVRAFLIKGRRCLEISNPDLFSRIQDKLIHGDHE